MRLPIRLLPPLLALAAIVAAASAAADHRQSYLDGVRALERGELERARARLGAAIAERSREQARARLVGVIPEPYLPHHYLGLAHFRARDCKQALAEWRISERQGAVQSVGPAHRLALGHRDECERLSQADEAIEQARQEADALAAAAAGAGDAWRRDPGLEARRQRALAALASAEHRLAEGRRQWDFAPVAAALETARGAVEQLDALREEAAGLAERAPPPEELTPAAPVRPRPSDPAPPAPIPTAGAGPDAPAAGADGGPLGPHPAPGTTDGGSGGDAPAAEAAPATPAEPIAGRDAALPGELMAAVQAYLDGDCRGAVDRLTAPGVEAPLAAAGRRALFLAALFRGACRHALYLLGGERDAGLLRAAGADVAECRRLDPDFTPSRTDFSPRFVAFYRQQR